MLLPVKPIIVIATKNERCSSCAKWKFFDRGDQIIHFLGPQRVPARYTVQCRGEIKKKRDCIVWTIRRWNKIWSKTKQKKKLFSDEIGSGDGSNISVDQRFKDST